MQPRSKKLEDNKKRYKLVLGRCDDNGPEGYTLLDNYTLMLDEKGIEYLRYMLKVTVLIEERIK